MKASASAVGRSRPVFSGGGAVSVVRALHAQRLAAVNVIDVRTAQATVEADRARIMKDIESMAGGTGAMSVALKQAINTSIWQWQSVALQSWVARRAGGSKHSKWSKIAQDFEQSRLEV